MFLVSIQSWVQWFIYIGLVLIIKVIINSVQLHRLYLGYGSESVVLLRRSSFSASSWDEIFLGILVTVLFLSSFVIPFYRILASRVDGVAINSSIDEVFDS